MAPAPPARSSQSPSALVQMTPEQTIELKKLEVEIEGLKLEQEREKTEQTRIKCGRHLPNTAQGMFYFSEIA